MKLKRKFFVVLLGFFLGLTSPIYAKSFTGLWEVKTPRLELTRVEIQPINKTSVLVRLIQKRSGRKISLHTGRGQLRGKHLGVILRELGGIEEIRANFTLVGNHLLGRWDWRGKKYAPIFISKNSQLPLGSTEVFSGDRPEDLKNIPESLKIFKALELALDFDFQNKEVARGGDLDLGLFKVKNGTKISASIKARKNPSSPDDLFVEKLVLTSSESIRIADKYHIRSVTINEKGHISFNIDNFPDLTITKIAKKSNGDTRIYIKHFPDLTIKKNGKVKLWGFIPVGKLDKIHLPRWPLDLSKLVKYFQGNEKLSKNGETVNKILSNIGHLNYKIKAVGDPKKSLLIHGVPVKTNALSLDLKGSLVSENGKLVSRDGQAKIHLELGDTAFPMGLSEGKISKGVYDLKGRYKIEIPLKKDGSKMALYFDGESKYSFEGGKSRIVLPDDTSIFLEGVRGSGTNRISIRDLASGLDGVTIKDGKLHVTADGPASIRSLREGSFYYGDLPLNTNLTLDSRYSLDRGELKTTSTFHLVSEVAGPGLVEALKFNPLKKAKITTRLKRGTKVTLDMDKVTTSLKLGEALDKLKVSGRGRGSVELNMAGGEGSYENFRGFFEGTGTLRGDSSFEFNRTPGGFKLSNKTTSNFKTSLALKPGTKLSIKDKNGKWTTLKIQGNKSFLRFSVEVATRNGKAYLKEARNVNVLLEVGDIEATLLGWKIRGRGKKTLLLEKGTLRFLPEGVDIYGNLAVRIEGNDSEPVLSVRWN